VRSGLAGTPFHGGYGSLPHGASEALTVSGAHSKLPLEISSSGVAQMKELVESIARALVDHPEDVQVKSVEGSQVTVLELRVHPEDLGKVIGRQGRTAKAVRTLLGAAGMKLKKRFTLEILED